MIQTDNEKKKQSLISDGVGAADYNAEAEMNRLYSALNSRRGFSYDPNSDPMYRSYARQYDMNGRMAMKNSMGQAAALTGGYGSSYGAAVGQQQYDEYLRQLSDQLPELYEFAYQRYEDEGRALRDKYDMAYQRYETDYRRGQDAQAELRRQEQQDYDRRQDSYSSLTKLISNTGYRPTDDELDRAGMTRAQADALLNRYLMDNGLLGGGSGSGGGGGGRSSSSKKKEEETAVKTVVKPSAKSSAATKTNGSGIGSSASRTNDKIYRSVRV